MIRELAAACALLTRLPVGRYAESVAPARCVWAYPAAGALVGAIAAATYALLRWAASSAPLAAIWALAVAVVLTGALHEDGLADAADGFAGGRTPEQRLSIMRDSRIGSFGALALLLTSAIRIAAVAALPAGAAAAALIASGALGRAAMLVPLLLLHPARTGGLGAMLAATRLPTAAAGLALGALIAFAVLPPHLAAAAILLAGVAALGMAALARRWIGGYTGDVFGATSVIAECIVLSLLSTRVG